MTSTERWRRWYEANREHFRAYQSAYAKRRRDEARGGPLTLLAPEELRRRKLARLKAWREANPIFATAGHAAINANKRAARLGIPDRLSAQDIFDMWTRQPDCVGCGSRRGVDHIVNMRDGGANKPSNLQNLCISCNSRKENARRRHAAPK